MKKLFLVGFLVLLSTSCMDQKPSEYKPVSALTEDGYSDRQINSNTYEIQVRGNAATSVDILKSYFHRRAAELCKSSNYTHDLDEKSTTVIRDGMWTGYTYIPTTMSSYPYVPGTVKCNS